MQNSALWLLMEREALHAKFLKARTLRRLAAGGLAGMIMLVTVTQTRPIDFGRWICGGLISIGVLLAMREARGLRVMLAQEREMRTFGILIMTDLQASGAVLHGLIRRLPLQLEILAVALPPMIWATAQDSTWGAGDTLGGVLLVVAGLWAFSGMNLLSSGLWRPDRKQDWITGVYQVRHYLPFIIGLSTLQRILGLGSSWVWELVYGIVAPLAVPFWILFSGASPSTATWCGAVGVLLLEGSIAISLATPLLLWLERRRDRRPWKERLRDWYRQLTWYRKPPIVDGLSAIAWRDYVFLYGGRRRWLWVVLGFGVCWLGLSIAGLWLVAQSNERFTPVDTVATATGIMSVVALLFAVNQPIRLAVSAFDHDREGKTLSLLWLTPVTAREFARAKFYAIWLACRVQAAVALVLVLATALLVLGKALLASNTDLLISLGIGTAIGIPIVAYVSFIWWLCMLVNLLHSARRLDRRSTGTMEVVAIPVVGALLMILSTVMVGATVVKTFPWLRDNGALLFTLMFGSWGVIAIGVLVLQIFQLRRLNRQLFQELRDISLMDNEARELTIPWILRHFQNLGRASKTATAKGD